MKPSEADCLEGHTPKTDGGLAYGKNRNWERVIDEQRSAWEDGPLGFAFGPKVVIDRDMQPFLAVIRDLLDGKIDPSEFKERTEG